MNNYEKKFNEKKRYAMVIDLRRCIGCHSCSVACKAENRVPLGVFRSWVKIIEKRERIRDSSPMRKEGKMETRVFSKSWFSSIINYSILAWTIICFIGTWFIILKYGILLKGLIAIAVTFIFAAAIWAIPFAGLILLSLYVTPPEEPLPFVMFKELIKRGMEEHTPFVMFKELIKRGMRRSSV